jgi:hypothetical protein
MFFFALKLFVHRKRLFLSQPEFLNEGSKIGTHALPECSQGCQIYPCKTYQNGENIPK